MFDQKYIGDEHNLFEAITNQKYSLYKLIELNKKKNNDSKLVRDLIQLICNKIEVKKSQLMNDTFHTPATTNSTYVVLFEDSFKALPIYQKVIEQLIFVWEEWENDGFQAADIRIWSELREKQRRIVSKIWNTIAEKAQKTISFEKLIDEATKNTREIFKVKDDVTFCINTYCQDACDKSLCFSHLQDIENQLRRRKVPSIKIPNMIEILKPLADRLHRIWKSHAWQKFFEEHKSKPESKFISS